MSPAGSAPSCSVVVCTRDRPEELDRCLKSASCLDYPRFDVLVVDNAPSDGRSRAIARRRGARYVVEPETGLSRARNLGARACRSEIVAYLDDDAVCEPRWLAGLAREFQDPEVMAAAGRILPTPEPISREDRRLASLIGFPLGGLDRRVVDRRTPSWFEMSNFGGVGSGANMAFRRGAFELWPGFDARLGRGAPLAGGEEHYAFFSLIDRGWRVAYTPDAVVSHPFPKTLRELRLKRLQALSASAGYIAFLFVEEPDYRREVVRYSLQALLGIRRRWRERITAPSASVVGRRRVCLACLSGLALYARSRSAGMPREAGA